MTELQKTEFEILRCFDAACRELGLPYFLVCGSALGAVKYGGFIPWDDDIDVAMYREDYNRFLELAPTLLPRELFLQNYRTDPACPLISSKLRNSNTTYVETSAANLSINHGVFIDIFPLDGYPRGKAAQKYFELKKRLYTGMMQSNCDYPRTALGNMICRFCRITGISAHTYRVAERYEQMITRYPVCRDGIVCNHANWQGNLDYTPWSWFGNGSEAEFEGLFVLIPQQSHLYLSRKYGDYSQDPEKNSQVGHHYYLVCDCGRPYTQYQRENGGFSYEAFGRE